MSIFPTQTCQIKRTVDGHTGDDGNWVPASEDLIATVEADIQPKGSHERVTKLQTEYESDHKAFIDFEDITFEAGYSEIEKGDILIDADQKEYTVVFPGKWDDHYQADLKEN